MIAAFSAMARWVADSTRFILEVWRDARALREDCEGLF